MPYWVRGEDREHVRGELFKFQGLSLCMHAGGKEACEIYGSQRSQNGQYGDAYDVEFELK